MDEDEKITGEPVRIHQNRVVETSSVIILYAVPQVVYSLCTIVLAAIVINFLAIINER